MPKENENTPAPDKAAIRRKKEQEAKVSTSRLERRLRGRPRLVIVGETMHAINVGVSGFLLYIGIEKSQPYLGLLGAVGGVIFAKRVVLYDRLRRQARKERKAYEALRGGRQQKK